MKTAQDIVMIFQPRQTDVRWSARQSGSALIYILIAIALLAALTVSLMEPANQQAQTQNTTNLVTTIENQVSFITSALQECALSHPNQDSGLTLTQQRNPPYPINPHDPYYTAESATPGPAANDNVAGIRCPGNPGGSGSNNQDHARMFGGGSGKFMPPPPALFGNWRYYNGEDGIFIMISSDKSDAYIQSALTRLDGMYANCEADVINRLGTTAVAVAGDTVPGDGAAKQCPAGHICFRHWFKQNASASDQVSAGCP
jgi:hypothetical protein